MFGSYFEYHTLRESLSLIYELPDLTSLEMINYIGYAGFKIKQQGDLLLGLFLEKKMVRFI